jgi:hypothetical protein
MRRLGRSSLRRVILHTSLREGRGACPHRLHLKEMHPEHRGGVPGDVMVAVALRG